MYMPHEYTYIHGFFFPYVVRHAMLLCSSPGLQLIRSSTRFSFAKAPLSNARCAGDQLRGKF